MSTVTIHEAKTHLSRLIQRALSGEEIIIARRDEPLVRLQILESANPARRFGGQKALIQSMGDTFDDELADFGERTACIGLAGEDASPQMLARLAKAHARVVPLSACVQDVGGISVRASGQPALLLALRDYVRNPEGGRVVLRRTEQPLQPRDRNYLLRLDDGQWSFVAEAPATATAD